MVAIGFRANTSEINYVIIDGSVDNPQLLDKGKLRKPKAFELPDALSWYRKNLLELFTQYSVERCGIKTAEPFSRSMGAAAYQGSIIRANVEGVIMESAQSSGLRVIAGPFSVISSNIDSKKPKKYIGADEFRAIKEWEKLNQQYQEAVLAGVASLNN